jgi:hypothetical protein
MEPLHYWRHSHEFRLCSTLRTARLHTRLGVRDYTVLERDIVCFLTDTDPEQTAASHFTLKIHKSHSIETVFKTSHSRCILNNRKSNTSKQNIFIYLPYDQQTRFGQHGHYQAV